MIPCLYDSRETKFNHNGIGKLADAQSCTVTEKRNGSYELKLVCPADGIHAEMLEEGNIILAKPSDTMQSQPFRIYKITTPIDGKLEVQARHISYQLNFITVSPFSVSGCAGAVQGLKSHAASDCPFSVWTDVASSAMFTVSVPASFRNCLGGMDGSVLDTFGGEFEWDRYTVKFHRARGADHNVHIVYGKNLTDFKMEKSIENTITGVHPYWVDNETQAVMELPEKVVMVSRKSVPYQKITVLDCTSAFQEKPSEAALREYAQDYIDTTSLTEPEVDIKIDFIRSIYPKAKEGLDALQESKVDANYDATGELTEGITVNTINGETQKFEHVQTTALTPVDTACQKVYYTGQVFNWIGVAGYDANGTFVASILDSRDTEQPQEYKEKELEIPEGVFQIRASSYAKDLSLKVCGESAKLWNQVQRERQNQKKMAIEIEALRSADDALAKETMTSLNLPFLYDGVSNIWEGSSPVLQTYYVPLTVLQSVFVQEIQFTLRTIGETTLTVMLESEEGEVFTQTVELVKGDNKIILFLHRFIDEGAYKLRVRSTDKVLYAKAKCDENLGSRVFDNDGNVIYPEEAVPVTGAEEAEEKPVMDEPEGKVPNEEPSEEKDTPVTDEQKEGPGKEEYPTAEELPAAIAYGKLKTLMNIREMPDTSAEVVAIYKKNTLIEIVEFCAGWLKIKCTEAASGLAYVLNSADTYAFTASKIYTVVPGDNLWKIAEKELGDGSRCADIRALNGLTSNAIRVGMKLLIP